MTKKGCRYDIHIGALLLFRETRDSADKLISLSSGLMALSFMGVLALTPKPTCRLITPLTPLNEPWPEI